VTKHESAHVLAAAFLGVRADLSIGHRMFFPVIQTDLTSLWAVDRNDRYIAYSAGIVSDLATIALIVISFWLNAHGIVAVGEPFQLLLTIALLVVTTTVVWQFNFFMKTDVYYAFLWPLLSCLQLISLIVACELCSRYSQNVRGFYRALLWPPVMDRNRSNIDRAVRLR
jgi:hypothetical protein